MLLKVINHLPPNHIIIFNFNEKKITISNVRERTSVYPAITVDARPTGTKKITFSELVFEMKTHSVRNIILRDDRGSEMTFMSVAELLTYLAT